MLTRYLESHQLENLLNSKKIISNLKDKTHTQIILILEELANLCKALISTGVVVNLLKEEEKIEYSYIFEFHIK
jgi:hypothetical protein